MDYKELVRLETSTANKIQQYLLKEEAALGYRVDESDGGEGCGNICKASLLTLAGFGTLAVYNGLIGWVGMLKVLASVGSNSLFRKGVCGGQTNPADGHSEK